jgi:hypothetical protein
LAAGVAAGASSALSPVQLSNKTKKIIEKLKLLNYESAHCRTWFGQSGGTLVDTTHDIRLDFVLRMGSRLL